MKLPIRTAIFVLATLVSLTAMTPRAARAGNEAGPHDSGLSRCYGVQTTAPGMNLIIPRTPNMQAFDYRPGVPETATAWARAVLFVKTDAGWVLAKDRSGASATKWSKWTIGDRDTRSSSLSTLGTEMGSFDPIRGYVYKVAMEMQWQPDAYVRGTAYEWSQLDAFNGGWLMDTSTCDFRDYGVWFDLNMRP